jgi:hypothetical protein
MKPEDLPGDAAEFYKQHMDSQMTGSSCCFRVFVFTKIVLSYVLIATMMFAAFLGVGWSVIRLGVGQYYAQLGDESPIYLMTVGCITMIALLTIVLIFHGFQTFVGLICFGRDNSYHPK